MDTRKLYLPDFVVLLVSALLALSVMAPKIERAREVARANQCQDNLKQLGLAAHNYHAAFNQLPPGSGGTDRGSEADPLLGNSNRLSAWVPLTPFYEQQPLWEKIANPMTIGRQSYPAMGPVPWYDPKRYTPWSERPTTLICASDPDAAQFAIAASYVVNYGDGIFDVGAPEGREMEPYSQDESAKRGVFKRESVVRFRDILDGLTNTAMFSESKILGSQTGREIAGLPLNPSLCIEAQKNQTTKYWPAGRDACWADGSLRSTGFQTVLQPNSPSATSDKGELEGVMSISSHHVDGAHVLFADGAVKFVTNSIDAGDSSSPSVAGPAAGGEAYAKPNSKSPYGLWGAIGTRSSREAIDLTDIGIAEAPPEFSAEELAELKSLPLEDWSLTKPESKFKARFVEIQSKKKSLFIMESGDAKSILLSDLETSDAVRTVEIDLKRKREARQELVTQLELGLSLLETKKFEQFATDFLPPELANDKDRDEVMRQVVKERGRLILMLDAALVELKSNTPSPRVRTDKSGSSMQINLDVNPRFTPEMRLQLLLGKWRLAL